MRNHRLETSATRWPSLELVLVVDDVPLDLVLAAVGELDLEAFAQRGDERLAHGGDGVAVALDDHLVADAQLALLDLEELVARGVLELERVAHPQRLAVDLEGLLAGAVLDPEVVADRE